MIYYCFILTFNTVLFDNVCCMCNLAIDIVVVCITWFITRILDDNKSHLLLLNRITIGELVNRIGYVLHRKT